jgi:hypothetical protein
MNEETSDFNNVLNSFKPSTSCDFVPQNLTEAIKPLVSIIPKKDRSGTILTVALSDKMSMNIKHKDIGDGAVEEIENIENIYHENDGRNASIPMHPKSFQEYTNLFSVEKGKLLASHQLVHYNGNVECGGPVKIEYLFPTCQV